MGHDHDWVGDRIAVGSEVTTPAHVAALVRAGVTHVVDCRDDAAAFAPLYRGTGIVHIPAPTLDDGAAKGPEWFALGVPGAYALARRGTRVLFHCHAGINRGPSMALFCAVLCGVDPDRAARAIRAARPRAFIAYARDAVAAARALAAR